MILKTKNEALLAQEIQDLLAENERLKARLRWIPVSERLPERDGAYLVKFRGDRRQCLKEELLIKSTVFISEYSCLWTHGRLKYRVTHWRPIDAPEATHENS